MADINQVVLVGRVVRDAELRYANSGTPILTFSLAINRRRRQGDQWTDEANFFDVEYIRSGAEKVHQYVTKGKQLGVQGELRQDRWEKEGQTRTKVKVHAVNLQLLGGSGGGAGSGPGAPDQGRPDFSGSGYSGDTGSQPADNDTFDDDVPF